MYSVKENPLSPEWLVLDAEGEIVCRILNNDHCYSDTPDEAAQQFAETIVNALNKATK
jgi:hypothetical protein